VEVELTSERGRAMSRWEHCAVYVALYRDGTGGGTRELLSVQMPGESQKAVTNALGVIGPLNDLGGEGWELVDVEASVLYLKRPKRSASSS
jgi:hypothetical protein